MTILPRKGLLAIAVVVDVALQTDGRPISAKSLATRHGLPPRHLDSVLQSLARDGILKGIRGPYGGYELARERRGVTANDILRAADTVHEAGEEPNSELVAKVVLPALSCRAGIRTGAEPYQSGRHGPPCSPQWRRNGSPRRRRRVSRRLVGRSILADSMAATLLQSSSHPTRVAAPKLYRNKQHAGCCPNVAGGRRSSTFHRLAKVRPERSSGRCDRADQRRNAPPSR